MPRHKVVEDPDSFHVMERRSVVKEWARFKEHVKIEEYHRENFNRHFEEKQHNALPEAVRKFIATIKHSVHASMRHKGGTPFSIIRQMFLYWDRDKTGKVSESDLMSCMLSLGVRGIKPDEIRIIIRHYNSKTSSPNSPYMSYDLLLRDVQDGEPTIVECVDAHETPQAARFTFENEKYVIQPPLIKQFIHAIRVSVMRRIRKEGGTPFSIVRQIFMHYDLNYSSALNAPELIQAMRKGMGLVFTEAHAREVLKFYNRTGSGEFGYQILLKDIVDDFPSMLDFTVSTDSYLTMQAMHNPFVKRDFELKDNKTIEAFRSRLLRELKRQIAARGGSSRSLIRAAFLFWDSRCQGKLQLPQHVVGALKRLGIEVSPDELRLLMIRYDQDNDGELNYNLFIEDMARDETSFLNDTGVAAVEASPTARSPANVSSSIQIFRSKAEGYATKTGGRLVPRDILHGLFLSHDPSRTGHIGLEALKKVCAQLHIGLSDPKLQVLIAWFDSNGSNKMDYNAFIDQLYGSDSLAATASPPKSTHPFATYDLLHHHVEGEGTLAHTNVKKTLFQKKAQKLKDDEEKRVVRLSQMKAEKSLIKSKLASIEHQKKVLEDLRK